MGLVLTAGASAMVVAGEFGQELLLVRLCDVQKLLPVAKAVGREVDY